MTGKIFSGPAYFPVRTTRFGPVSTMLAETGQAGPDQRAQVLADFPNRPDQSRPDLLVRTGLTGPGQAGPENQQALVYSLVRTGLIGPGPAGPIRIECSGAAWPGPVRP
ncbi:hypothetical protein TIFTF001_051300, partial [Ficus carica]